MGADIKGGRSFRTLYTTIKTKNCLYGGFFVLKDREAFDSKQRGSWRLGGEADESMPMRAKPERRYDAVSIANKTIQSSRPTTRR